MTQAAQNVQSQSILLVLHLSKPGNRRKVAPGLVEVDADRASITVAKELLQCQELADILTLDGSIRRYVYARSLPSGVLKEGVYRLPLSLVEEVDAGLKEFQQRRAFLVDVFTNIYPQKVEEARARLRALYDGSDYPEAEEVRGAFGLEWRYLSLDVPSTISQNLIERERQKIAADMAAEVDEIRLALRTAFAELVQHAAERLQVGKDGRPLVFRDSLVSRWDDFLAYFQARNIVGDTELAALVEKARAVIHGITPEELRANIDVRQRIQRSMEEIKTTMDSSMMLRPSRRFSLTPEAQPVS